jgi:hypothetical protein
MMTKLSARIAVVVAAVAAALAGCDKSPQGQEPGMKHTITQAEAQQRAESYVQDALNALSPGLQLEKVLSETAPCSDPSDNGPPGRVFASNRYWIRGLPKDQNNPVVDTLRRWSAQQGFMIVSDAWDKAKFITLEHPSTGFRFAIQESAQGDLSIGASSPCVWPNGTP